MITELMLLLIVVGAGIVFVAWSNTRRRKQDILERREVADSTGKLKQELERTANEIIGRMENHVTHLENVLDESERNRTQLEGRVTELKKLLKKSEGQSGEIRDLLARLDDAGLEIDSMQRKMDIVERKLNLAMTAPLPIQQPVTIPQMPLFTQPQTPPPVAPIKPPEIKTPPIAPKVEVKPPPPIKTTPPAQVTTTPAEPINPLGPITVPPIIRPKEFDKILEESLAEQPPPPRKSIVLSPENKKPVAVIDADPVKIEATRKKLHEASAEMAKRSQEETEDNQAKPLQKKRRSARTARDVRKAAIEAIRAAEQSSAVEAKPAPPPPKKILPERRDLKLETTDSSVIKEMLLSGMSIEDIARETGLGRSAIELVQELTRRQLNRR
ncbi:MAG: hypothetical protein IKI76_10600 [Selenomonadaceae bacterium]|nr:hypothetical protein [Selenomonadaceae bacterium]